MKNRTKISMILFVSAAVAINTFAVWQTETCPDGRAVAIAPGGTGFCGRDSRTVSVPPGWGQKAGSDGRGIAIPPGGTAERGKDYRLIAVPKGWSFKIGKDGRGVAIPPGGDFKVGTDKVATVLPPDNFDLTDYVTIYCILGIQAGRPVEEAPAPEDDVTNNDEK